MAHCVRCCCWILVLTLLSLAVTAAVVFVRNRNGGQVFPLPGVPGSVDHKYAEALALALQFFQVQKCMHAITLFPSKLFARVHYINLCDLHAI